MHSLLALVVEDDPLLRLDLADALRGRALEVIECDSAEAGELVLARTGLELDVLVTDVELAGRKTGLELARFAIAQFPRLCVVVISGRNGLQIPDGASFLMKPFRTADLLQVVASIT